MTSDSKQRQRRTENEWCEIISRFEQSKLRSAEFCEAEGISLHSFRKWRTRFLANGKSQFIEITPPQSSKDTVAGPRVELEFPGGLVLRVS
jgi:hypothetical protein